MNRADCLDEAKRIICQDRNNSYGEPEDSFTAIAVFWTVYLRQAHNTVTVISAEDVAWMMVLLKISRQTHKHKEDNFVDAAGYAALAAEVARIS